MVAYSIGKPLVLVICVKPGPANGLRCQTVNQGKKEIFGKEVYL
jgi:hypothetical protein